MRGVKKAGSRGLSIRWRITLPYLLLALILGFGAALLINRVLSQSSQERFWRQVADGSQQASDAVVRIEQDLLEVERLIANTEGLAEAVVEEDAEALRDRVLPLVINAGVDSAAVLDSEGRSLLAVRHHPDDPPGSYERAIRGEAFYAEWDMVRAVLGGQADSSGDKYSDIESVFAGSQEMPTFFLVGPVSSESGEVIGAVVVGRYLDSIVDSLKDQAGVNVSIYHPGNGLLIQSTLEQDTPQSVMLNQEQLAELVGGIPGVNSARIIDVAGSSYGEVLLPLNVRDGTRTLGVLGASILAASVEAEIAENIARVARLGALALVLVAAAGLLISQSVVRSITVINNQLVQAVEGRLEGPVTAAGGRELTMLAEHLNRILSKPGESRPDYSSRLSEKQAGDGVPTLAAASATTGARAVVSALVILVKRLPDRLGAADPDSTLSNLALLVDGTTPIVLDHGGFLSHVRGDEITVYFGVSPELQRPQVNSLQATHAAMEIRDFVDRWNRDRADKGLPALEVGMGIATGEVVVGALDTRRGSQPAVVGDVVHTANHIAEITQAIHGNNLLISEETYRYLASAQQHFEFGRYGKTVLQGNNREVLVYEIRDRMIRLRD